MSTCVNPDSIIFDGEEWRKIPTYPKCYATKTGRIAGYWTGVLIERSYQYLTDKRRENDNSNYVFVTMPKGKVVRTAIGVHRLVCLTWNGPPPDDGRVYEVNHIDGVKTNNNADNLEWLTGSDNVLHCFNLGQHKTAIRVVQTNVLTLEKRIFRSKSELAEFIGIPRTYMMQFIAKYSTEPKDNYIYRLEKEDTGYIPTPSRQVAYKDYLTNKVTLTISAVQAGRMTGYRPGTIVAALKRNREKGVKLTGQYVFLDLTSNPEWPPFTEEDVKEALADMKKRRALTQDRRFSI